jgi:ubiquitin-conjugating enzyme E2 R
MAAVPHLQKQLKELTTKPLGGFRVEVNDDLFQWTVWFAGPAGTPYHPAHYKAVLSFPSDFPMKPPEFRIVSSFWHPNVYPDGRVCISILHPPGEDEMNSGETAMMRWTPIQSIQSVLLSVISLLSDPDSQDAGAPANVDALVQFRKDKEAFNSRCQELAKKALLELPAGFVPPSLEDAKHHVPQERGMSFLASEDFVATEDEVEQHPYGSELTSLRDMGVGADRSDDELLAMLTKCKGDIATVMERLE